MLSENSDIEVAAVVGFGAGIYWFFKGFRLYRKYRVLADTPEMPIRSIAMGLVEIHGKATGEQIVVSPVSHSPCLFYKVDIERWETDSKGRGHWADYLGDADGPLFYLQDGSGKVLVDAHEAEFDLMQTGRTEIGGTRWSGPLSLAGKGELGPVPGLPALDSGLQGYVSRVAAGMRSALFQGMDISLSDPSKKRWQKARPAGGGLNLLKRLALGGKPAWFGGGSSYGSSYRLTEYLILPDHWYDVTGTCVENPNPKDEHDRNLIVKGQNEPTFLISWRSEKEVEGNLRRRALLHIFGGAGLSIFCLAWILTRFGWL